MELACSLCSSLRFSSHQYNAASRYRKLSASPSCNAASSYRNLSASPSCNAANLVLKFSNNKKTLLYRNYYRNTPIQVCLQNLDYFYNGGCSFHINWAWHDQNSFTKCVHPISSWTDKNNCRNLTVALHPPVLSLHGVGLCVCFSLNGCLILGDSWA